jgi:hypothetical protein
MMIGAVVPKTTIKKLIRAVGGHRAIEVAEQASKAESDAECRAIVERPIKQPDQPQAKLRDPDPVIDALNRSNEAYARWQKDPTPENERLMVEAGEVSRRLTEERERAYLAKLNGVAEPEHKPKYDPANMRGWDES